MWENFTYREFDSPDVPGSGTQMDTDFLDALDEARDLAGIPFVINSGFRTKAHNEDLRAQGFQVSANSSHLKGLAADIAVRGSTERMSIVAALLSAGFTRLGIGHGFVHVDSDDKAQGVIWVY